ncbi:uncharacterized protein PSFLO_05832 [Pseudozyma flocculosa]|uniref:Uncharacterized protein n=1 Tax=Pseudozyma flocculosa TaxID=84751 RepID=A0A5C3F807_9BASI|nr:uncharacterized protein PSFLO_05832 [Pseudozyma flocculosa]
MLGCKAGIGAADRRRAGSCPSAKQRKTDRTPSGRTEPWQRDLLALLLVLLVTLVTLLSGGTGQLGQRRTAACRIAGRSLRVQRRGRSPSRRRRIGLPEEWVGRMCCGALRCGAVRCWFVLPQTSSGKPLPVGTVPLLCEAANALEHRAGRWWWRQIQMSKETARASNCRRATKYYRAPRWTQASRQGSAFEVRTCSFADVVADTQRGLGATSEASNGTAGTADGEAGRRGAEKVVRGGLGVAAKGSIDTGCPALRRAEPGPLVVASGDGCPRSRFPSASDPDCGAGQVQLDHEDVEIAAGRVRGRAARVDGGGGGGGGGGGEGSTSARLPRRLSPSLWALPAWSSPRQARPARPGQALARHGKAWPLSGRRWLARSTLARPPARSPGPLLNFFSLSRLASTRHFSLHFSTSFSVPSSFACIAPASYPARAQAHRGPRAGRLEDECRSTMPAQHSSCTLRRRRLLRGGGGGKLECCRHRIAFRTAWPDRPSAKPGRTLPGRTGGGLALPLPSSSSLSRRRPPQLPSSSVAKAAFKRASRFLQRSPSCCNRARLARLPREADGGGLCVRATGTGTDGVANAAWAATEVAEPARWPMLSRLPMRQAGLEPTYDVQEACCCKGSLLAAQKVPSWSTAGTSYILWRCSFDERLRRLTQQTEDSLLACASTTSTPYLFWQISPERKGVNHRHLDRPRMEQNDGGPPAPRRGAHQSTGARIAFL